MFGAMTSLTGGGGFTGGAATATTGDQTVGGTTFGGVQFGNKGPNWGMIAVIALLAAVLLWKH
jgi:hypothetical protein